MNKLTIIGNLTRDPEMRTTSTGINVTTFTVAVNRRGRRDEQSNQPDADFFRVSAWRALGENCAKFLQKGRKVAVVGAVSLHMYTGSDGQTRASLEVNADDVEFLSSRNDAEAAAGGYTAPAAEAPAAEPQAAPGFTAVETDELPF
jgi:single-strand DNA-binding protein